METKGKGDVMEFIRFAVSHAKDIGDSFGENILLFGSAGKNSWEYLYGTHGHVATKTLLNSKYKSYYSKHGWSRAEFDTATEGWAARGQVVTDCEGLLDSFLHVDYSANYCYKKLCGLKGKISEVDRPWIVGEAVFMGNAAKKTHVGWICGCTADGVPLVVEARGLRYGVCITRMDERPWTYRGLMTNAFLYAKAFALIGAGYVFTRVLKVGVKGVDVVELKKLLIAHGYTDGITTDTDKSKYYGASTRKAVKAFQKDAGLKVDGKAGKETIRALGGKYA